MRPVASPLFQGLSAEEWAALEQSGCLRTKSYPRHAVIFHAGEHVHALGVVLRGTVHIENLDLWGSKSILSSISAGQAFAETYALCGDVMMVDAVAAEECEVLFVNISAFSGGAPGTVHEKLLRNLLTVSMRKNLSLSQRIFCTIPSYNSYQVFHLEFPLNISRFLKNPLITGTLLMTASGIASRIIGFFYRIFLAQTIGAEALGIYQLIAPVFAMCFALTASSIQTSISKFVGDACGKNAGTSQGEITARGYLLLGLVISCTASVIVGIFLYTQSDWIALHFLGELRCAPLLSLLSFSMLPCCIHACINGYYYGKKRAGIPSFCQLVEQLARVGSVWLIYQYTLEKGMELTAFHAVAGLVAGECSGLITSLIAMSLEKRLPGHSYHTLSGQWKTMGKLFASMAVPLTINRVTTALFNSLENLLIPQKLQAFGYSASDALSIFGILTGMTMSIILFPSVLTNSFSVLLLPAVSEAHSAHNHAQIARTIKKAILYGLLLGFVFTILFLVFGARMGEVLFHNTLAGNFICQLSWLCPLLYVTSLLNSILHGLGNARQVLFVTLLACMIRICMILFLVPQYGIDAYLWGMLLSYVFAAIADILLLMPYSRAG